MLRACNSGEAEEGGEEEGEAGSIDDGGKRGSERRIRGREND